MKFRHYNNSETFGNFYIFGLNLYRDGIYFKWTLDLILGKHVFVVLFARKK